MAGQEFWLDLTGDESFYFALIDVFSECAKDYKESDLLDEVVAQSAEDI